MEFKKMASFIVFLLISGGIFAQAKANRPQTPEPPFAYNIENVSFENKKDSITLAGTFTFPESGSNFPVVILISGSGPQNRDSEIFGHKSFWVMADYLTKNGIAVLRYDDRGTGESTGEFSKGTSVNFANDAVAALNYLKTRNEINPKKIGLIGHSEGGVIAPMIAAENNDVAFVVTMAGVMIPGSELMIIQKEMQLRAMGSSEAYITKEKEFDTGIMQVITTSSFNELKDNLGAYSDKYFQENPKFASEHGMTAAYYKTLLVTSYSSPWLSAFIKYDPIKSLEKMKCPLLALNGERDLQVSATENLGALKKIMDKDSSKKFTLKSYPNLNHLFQECKTGTVQEYGQIEQTISPQILADIAGWINAQ